MSDNQEFENVEEVVEVPQEASQTSAYEAEARLMGWVPKEEFRGPEEHWIDSEAFVNRGKQILPIVKKNNEELTRKLLALEAKDRERDLTVAEWKEFMQEAQKREREQFKQQIETLKAQKKQAINEGDGELVVELDDAIDAIREQQKEAKVAPVQASTYQEPDPAFVAFTSENPWYGIDEDKTAYANGIGPAIRAAHPHLVGKDFLDMVAARVASKFPSKEVRVSSVEGSGAPSQKRTKHAYNSLPEEAKKAHDKFVKQKLMTSEEYIASYFEGN